MSEATFVYGSELLGDGALTRHNIIIGASMSVLATLGVIFGSVNLYYIRKVKIFHNAFGWLWASRTVGEIIVEITHATYNGPVTALYVDPTLLLHQGFRQPTQIFPLLGTAQYAIFLVGTVSSCGTHAFLAVNRNIAVFSPLRYGDTFSKKRSYAIIAVTWAIGFVVPPLYFVFPCNLVGYSPQQYSYIFVKCFAGQERDFSYFGTVANCMCLVLCICTTFVDLATLARIVYLRVILKKHKDDMTFERSVRFFKQNIIMVFSLVVVVHQNYRNLPKDQIRSGHKILNLTEIFSFIILHIVNPLALILFNPEIRGRLCGKISEEDESPQNSAPRVGPLPLVTSSIQASTNQEQQ
uniref:G_PROTEIN_RECEP_F1_2 domain-containing protein n=1 Tax=Steinernema glaseri TaxID=37863 RepID=A0A1I8A548_9BILA